MSASSRKKAKPRRAPAQKKGKVKAAKPKKVEKQAPAVVVEKPKKVAKPKKAAEKKEAPPKTAVRIRPVKTGPPPAAVVVARHLDSLGERAARGFSFGELSSAGIPLNAARRSELSVDVRRRSVVKRNVEALKGWFKVPGKAPVREDSEKQVAVAAVGKKK